MGRACVQLLHDAGANVVMGGRPTDHVAAPEEIARLILVLLSDAASYMRGQIVIVDDGQTIKL